MARRRKKRKDVVYTPSDFVAYMRRHGRAPKRPPPHGVVLCYSESVMKHVRNSKKARPWGHFGPEVHLLKKYRKRVGVVGPLGVGGPAAVTVLEELIALGVKEFILIGSAGGLQRRVKIGDVVLGQQAIPADGTSRHYLRPGEGSSAGASITADILAALRKWEAKARKRRAKKASGRSPTVWQGASWTTDAPYRETVADVEKYQSRNVLCVEMEAASLFAAAVFRGVEMGAMFAIGDRLAGLRWEPHFLDRRHEKRLKKIFGIAADVLSRRARG